MLESEKEAVEYFQPYFNDFLKCKNEVNKKVAGTISPETKADFESRTHSTIWNDLMSKALKRTFQDNFTPLRKYAQTTFNCANHYHLKTKKMDDHNQILFTPTQLAIEWLLYNMQFKLNGMPEAMKKIILGYKLNSIHTEIEDVYLAYPNGEKGFLWVHKIEPTVSKQATIDNLPPGLPPSDSYTNRPITPRNIIEKKEDDER